MSVLNIFKKTNIDLVTLPYPDDSVAFFETIKFESEKYWEVTEPNNYISGFQIQKGAKWRPGLDEKTILAFEKALGFEFPSPLRNFYRTMNGLSLPGLNLHANSAESTFRPIFYSYPDDLPVIFEYINWIYESNGVNKDAWNENKISRIFPVYSHRFVLIDEPGNPVLSMYGDDIIYWAKNLSHLLGLEIFDNIDNASDFETGPDWPQVNRWLDEHF